MADCVFCKIVRGEIPAKKIFENETTLAFKDLHPQAKFHALVIPKQHFESLMEASAEVAAATLAAAVKIAKDEKLQGFRVVSNNGVAAGQSVFHLHFHLLGGGQLRGSFA